MRQLKHLSLLLGLLLLGPSTYAQSVRFQSQAISSRGAGIANATVAVCTQPANTNTQPCSPLATLATSTTTTSGGVNPLTADSFGNFFFYAAPGRYTVQIYGPAVSGQFVVPDVEISSTGVTGAGVVRNANSSIAGADCVAKINTQDAAIGSAAGEIDIDTSCGTTWTSTLVESGPRIYKFLGGGSYSIPLGTLVFTKPTIVECSAHANTVLNFTGASGIALALNWATNAGGSYQDWSMGVKNCQIFGPGGIGGGGGNAGTGISISTSTNSPIGVLIENNLIGGFTTAQTWVSNSGANGFGGTFRNNNYINDTTAIAVNVNSESLVFDRNIFGNTASYQTCAVNVTGNVINMQMVNNEFDAGQLCMSTGNVTDINGHHENVTFTTTSPFVSMTGGLYSCLGCQFVQTQNSATLPPSFISNTGGRVVFVGGSFSNSSNTAMVNAVLNDTNGEYHQFGLVSVNGTAGGGAYSGGTIGNTAGWTGNATFDNSGASLGGFINTIAASGTSIPTYRMSRGSSAPVLWDMRVTDNLASNTWELVSGGTTYIQAVPTVVKFPTAVVQAGGGLTILANQALNFTNLFASNTAPTIAAAGCGGGAASIVVSNGTGAFKINVGTTPGSACTFTMPAATTGWNVTCNDITTQSTAVFVQKQTGVESTTSVTITNFNDVAVATAFVASDILKCTASAD